jgi:hypothetical protein
MADLDLSPYGMHCLEFSRTFSRVKTLDLRIKRRWYFCTVLFLALFIGEPFFIVWVWPLEVVVPATSLISLAGFLFSCSYLLVVCMLCLTMLQRPGIIDICLILIYFCYQKMYSLRSEKVVAWFTNNLFQLEGFSYYSAKSPLRLHQRHLVRTWAQIWSSIFWWYTLTQQKKMFCSKKKKLQDGFLGCVAGWMLSRYH